MNVNELLDTIEDALEESANVPLSGGKRNKCNRICLAVFFNERADVGVIVIHSKLYVIAAALKLFKALNGIFIKFM